MNKNAFLEKLKSLRNQNKKTKLSAEEINQAVELLDVEDVKLRFFIEDLISHQDSRGVSGLLEGAQNAKPEIRHSSIYLLGKIAKKKSSPEIVEALLQGLGDGNPKVRKISSIALGNLSIKETAEKLVEALRKESVEWVRPSLILALGAIGGETASNFLSSYEAETEAEQEALRKALDRTSERRSKLRLLEILPETPQVELWTYPGLEEVLVEEAKEKLGLNTKEIKKGVLGTETKNLYQLFSLRTFSELLIPIAAANVYNPKEYFPKISQLLCKNGAFKKILSFHKGEDSFLRYRLELKGAKIRYSPRRQIINEVVKMISSHSSPFINSPSNYDIEIRIIINQNILKLSWKPFTLPDNRFTYRVKDVPASINPVVAAGIVRLLKPKSCSNHQVLDPFCGSGTLLIERTLGNGCKELIGVDISKKAIEAAKENVAASNLKNIILINEDMRNIPKDKQFDEIITNMPFGLRAGSHAINLRLYQDFFRLIPKILKQNGLIALYTQEITLTNRLFQDSRTSLKLLDIHRVEVGGLRPAVFIGRKI